MQNSSGKQTKYHRVDSSSLSFKLFLVYDIFMVFIIIFNLFCLAANFFLMSSIGAWFFEHIHLPQVLSFYRTHLHPWVITSEAWFIGFLIIELLVRWGIAIVYKHHKRWFFFPFIHWYEILAIIPQLRFLRLFRAGIIAYRLHELGYPVIPESWRKTGLFYYRVVMEGVRLRANVRPIQRTRHQFRPARDRELRQTDRIIFLPAASAALCQTGQRKNQVQAERCDRASYSASAAILSAVQTRPAPYNPAGFRLYIHEVHRYQGADPRQHKPPAAYLPAGLHGQ